MRNTSGRVSRWLALLLLPLLVCSALASEPAAKQRQEKNSPSRFLRVARDEHESPLALETCIMRFAPAAGRRRAATVDLVAAVHIADKDYYDKLNREFEHYDAVLYELVAAEGASTPKPSDPSGNNPLSMLQNGMKDLLALEFQLKGIDYTRANMVHADMSPDEFAASMRKRGETPMKILARLLGYALAQQAESRQGASSSDLLLALFDKNRALALKRILAEEFAESEGSAAALDGPSGSTLISGRNGVALDVLRKELAAGKQRIAIFYGAAHMPDFQQRLQSEFRMVPDKSHWLVAWSLKP